MRVFLLGIFAAVLAHAQTSDLQALIDNRIEAKKAVGIVVETLDLSGSHLYSAGSTQAGGTQRPDGKTVFEIGSISKVFTSLLLADMIERGEVNGDDPVAKYLPGHEIPGHNGKQITLINLSMQNSGLPRLPDNFKPADPENPYADYDGPKMLAFLAGYKLTRDPGEKYEYSNLAVGLLGYTLAQRAHMSYEQLLRERILKPLHMDDTTITLGTESRKHLAIGHDESLKPVKNWDLDALAGAGAIRSTADDMIKFLAANLGLVETPLKAAMERMRSVRNETGIPHVEIAMAWHIFSEYPPDLYWHNGGTGGYRTFAGIDLQGKRAVVVLCNTSFGVDDIGKHALNNKYPAGMETEDKEIKLDPAILSEYVGVYRLAPMFALEFRLKDGRLSLQATGQPEFDVFASKKDEFFLKVVKAQLSFTRNAEGKVTSVVLHQNGMNMPGTKEK